MVKSGRKKKRKSHIGARRCTSVHILQAVLLRSPQMGLHLETWRAARWGLEGHIQNPDVFRKKNVTPKMAPFGGESNEFGWLIIIIHYLVSTLASLISLKGKPMNFGDVAMPDLFLTPKSTASLGIKKEFNPELPTLTLSCLGRGIG